jgi:hypothetical protein
MFEEAELFLDHSYQLSSKKDEFGHNLELFILCSVTELIVHTTHGLEMTIVGQHSY